jgi:hypothetical protein
MARLLLILALLVAVFMNPALLLATDTAGKEPTVDDINRTRPVVVQERQSDLIKQPQKKSNQVNQIKTNGLGKGGFNKEKIFYNYHF